MADPSRRMLVGAGAASTLAAALTLGMSQPAKAVDTPQGTTLSSPNIYDLTAWRIKARPDVTAQTDIGAVINDIIADVKKRQATPETRPGAMIIIPPGTMTFAPRSSWTWTI